MPHLLARIALVSLLASVTIARAQTPVTTCQQDIVGGKAELAVDLDCSANPLAIGVVLEKTKLYLNGHSITGAQIAVACAERCAIYGPGSITGNVAGINVSASQPNRAKVFVADVTIDGNATVGIGADKVKVTRSTITGNGGPVRGGGIFARVNAGIRSSTVDGNATYGVCSSGRIKLADSTAQGNGSDPGCIPNGSCGSCGDLVAPVKPRVSVRSTCDTSAGAPDGTWGVCVND